eukprot:scaffold8303_cov277-Pinguiococcus_pyrenoidosus.AAC.5
MLSQAASGARRKVARRSESKSCLGAPSASLGAARLRTCSPRHTVPFQDSAAFRTFGSGLVQRQLPQHVRGGGRSEGHAPLG